MNNSDFQKNFLSKCTHENVHVLIKVGQTQIFVNQYPFKTSINMYCIKICEVYMKK